MTTAYFDSSALVKLVIEEDGFEDAPDFGMGSTPSSSLANRLTELLLIVATWDGRLLRAVQASRLETLPAQL